METAKHQPEESKPSPGAIQPIGVISHWQNPNLRKHGHLIWFLTWAAVLTMVFIEPLYSLAIHAATTDLDSHILLVPFISAYLIYIQRKQLPAAHLSSPGVAIAFLLAGLAGLVAAWALRMSTRPLSQNDFLTLMVGSFLCFLAAGGFLFLGRRWMTAAAFPVAFLIFMIPLPDLVVDRLETASELASAEAADLFFGISGTPVLRDGTVFQLPGIVFRVAQECSGIHSSMVLFITSLLAAHLFLKSPWRRAGLVALVIPLGILRNGFRIQVIGLLCIHAGPQMIHSIIHKHGGPLFFALSLVPLFLLLWWLRSGEARVGKQGSTWRKADGYSRV